MAETDADLRALAADAMGETIVGDYCSHAGCLGIADDILDAVLPAHRAMVQTEMAKAIIAHRDEHFPADGNDAQRRARRILGIAVQVVSPKPSKAQILDEMIRMGIVERVAATPPDALSAPVADEDVPATPEEAQRAAEGDTVATEACCDLHGRNCEPPSELCCGSCTEAAHDTFPIRHADGSTCAVPDLSGSTVPPHPVAASEPAEPLAPEPERAWSVVEYVDRNERHWVHRSGRWHSYFGPNLIDGYADARLDDEAELVRLHGPLTPADVDNVAALLADQARYRQLYHQAVRACAQQPAQPDDPEEIRVSLAGGEVLAEFVRLAAERDEARIALADIFEAVAEGRTNFERKLLGRPGALVAYLRTQTAFVQELVAQKNAALAERDDARQLADLTAEQVTAYAQIIADTRTERDRLAATVERYQPVIDAAKAWWLANDPDIDAADRGLSAAVFVLADADQAETEEESGA